MKQGYNVTNAILGYLDQNISILVKCNCGDNISKLIK